MCDLCVVCVCVGVCVNVVVYVIVAAGCTAWLCTVLRDNCAKPNRGEMTLCLCVLMGVFSCVSVSMYKYMTVYFCFMCVYNMCHRRIFVY